MTRAPTLLPLLVAACGVTHGGADSSVDAAPPDAVHVWTCEQHPPPLPPPSTTPPTVVFDTPIPVLEFNDDGALATFAAGDEIVVATPRQLFVLTADGVLERTVALQLAGLPNPMVEVRDIDLVDARAGAVVRSFEDDRVRFCAVDLVTGIDLGRCTPLPTSSIAPPPRVSVTAAGYSVFGVRDSDQSLYEADFDDQAAPAGMTVLATDPMTSAFLIEAMRGPAMTLLVTAGNTGGMYMHRVVGTADTVAHVDPPPPLLYEAGLFGWDRWTAAQGPQWGEIVTMHCPEVSGESLADVMVVQRSWSLVDGTTTVTPLAQRFIPSGAFMLDGPGLAIAYEWGLQDMRLSRFDVRGGAITSELELPLSYGGRSELHFVGAGLSLAPGDYVFVYEADAERRVARVQIP